MGGWASLLIASCSVRSDALCSVRSVRSLLVARPGAPSTFLFLVVLHNVNVCQCPTCHFLLLASSFTSGCVRTASGASAMSMSLSSASKGSTLLPLVDVT